eukprot:RCo047693
MFFLLGVAIVYSVSWPSLGELLCDFTMAAPPAGRCAGPIARTAAIRKAYPSITLECTIETVPFGRDGTQQWQCGTCIPGTSAPSLHVESCDPIHCAEPSSFDMGCSTDQYCNDAGRCIALQQVSLFGAPCGSDLSCSPGLHCLSGRCLSCDRDSWPYSRCESGVYHPVLSTSSQALVAVLSAGVVVMGLAVLARVCSILTSAGCVRPCCCGWAGGLILAVGAATAPTSQCRRLSRRRN